MCSSDLTDPGCPVTIGAGCTIGHHAIIHGASIGDDSLIGMGATILDGAEIGDHCIIGANALVTQGKKIPPGSMVMGSPAKVVRELTSQERQALRPWAEKYIANARYCLDHKIGLGAPLPSAP